MPDTIAVPSFTLTAKAGASVSFDVFSDSGASPELDARWQLFLDDKDGFYDLTISRAIANDRDFTESHVSLRTVDELTAMIEGLQMIRDRMREMNPGTTQTYDTATGVWGAAS